MMSPDLECASVQGLRLLCMYKCVKTISTMRFSIVYLFFKCSQFSFWLLRVTIEMSLKQRQGSEKEGITFSYKLFSVASEHDHSVQGMLALVHYSL